MRAIFLLSLAATMLFSLDRFEELEKRPQGRTRDFASSIFLKSSTKVDPSRTIFYTMRSPKPKAVGNFAAIVKSRSLNALLACKQAAISSATSAECLAIALTVSQAENLDKPLLEALSTKVAAIDPNKSAWLSALAKANPLEAAARDPSTFFTIALGASESFWQKQPALKIGVEALQDDRRFSRVVQRLAVLNIPRENSRFLLAADAKKLDHKGAFYLAILQLQNDRFFAASAAFAISETKADTQYAKDRAAFWQWLTSTDKKAVDRLLSSHDINIYSLLAHEIYENKLPVFHTTAEAPKGAKAVYKEKQLFDPYFAESLSRKIHAGDHKILKAELAKLAHQDAQAYRAAILYALEPHKPPNFYLSPYQKPLEKLSADDRAIALAIMRQESRYIPSALSTSYAIGSMQMMPFLIEDMTKERKAFKGHETIWSFFSPYIELPYAIRHIAWLKSKLDHPLYIFYAYNAGQGFTRRLLDSRRLFQTGKYEPFLSMELVPVEETREYGKLVLSNYVIYKMLENDPITLDSLLRTLTKQND
ncbi:hypothetical protein AGMMS50229_15190 [Campylobacterota bacterium]|nr:hypothetical protein AGMMS50229_15190 [Campylobacterota bacterium]